VGGSEAKPNEFPWMVYILVQNFVTKKVFHCGGTLISDRHILTTSDCFFENQLFAVDILNITLGVHDLNANSSDSFRQIVKWIQIGSFVRLNNSLSAYLSIVTLGDPVELNGNQFF
jgi:secreted trypsin-like serine protease